MRKGGVRCHLEMEPGLEGADVGVAQAWGVDVAWAISHKVEQHRVQQ